MFICMRTTLDLDDHLMKRVRERALAKRTTITKVIEEALVDSMAGDRPVQASGWQLRWTPVQGKRAPRIDIADRDALYEAMEDRR